MKPIIPSVHSLPQRRVCHLRLVPLTLGHVFLAEELGLPFFSKEEADRDETVGEFFLAVFICSMPEDRAKRALSSWVFSPFMAIVAARAKRLDLLKERAEFFSYLRENLQSPRYKITGNGRELSSPWHLRLYASLRHLLHASHDELMAMPVITANAYRAAIGEDLGKLELMSRDTMSLLEIAKLRGAEQEAAIAAHNRRN